MKKIFRNTLDHVCIFNDDGVIFEEHEKFFPYGSIDKIKLNFSGVLTVTHNEISCNFAIYPSDKQAIKEMIDYALAAKKNAKPTTPQEYVKSDNDVVLEKDANAIIEYFGGMKINKQEQIVAGGIAEMVSSMKEHEKILYAFRGMLLTINSNSNTVYHFVALITNSKLYYIGLEGTSALSFMKAGSVELKDAHAVSIGAQTITAPAYVMFETKNDNYKLATFSNTSKIKSHIEKAIELAKQAESKPNPVQAGLSIADELKKFKELLDIGVITQEEFDGKKKQLLGL